MTPSSVTQFITITFPISCPFDLDGAIQMRHLVIAKTGVVPASCSPRPSRKFTPRSYSPKCVEVEFSEVAHSPGHTRQGFLCRVSEVRRPTYIRVRSYAGRIMAP